MRVPRRREAAVRRRSLRIYMGGMVHGIDWIPTEYDHRPTIARRIAEDMTRRLREVPIPRRDLGGARWWTRPASERIDAGGEPRNIAALSLDGAQPVACLDVNSELPLAAQVDALVAAWVATWDDARQP